MKFSMRAKQKVLTNFKSRRFERKMWVYIAAHDLHMQTWIRLLIVTALIKCKDHALQQGAAQGLLSLFTGALACCAKRLNTC